MSVEQVSGLRQAVDEVLASALDEPFDNDESLGHVQRLPRLVMLPRRRLIAQLAWRQRRIFSVKRSYYMVGYLLGKIMF